MQDWFTRLKTSAIAAVLDPRVARDGDAHPAPKA